MNFLILTLISPIFSLLLLGIAGIFISFSYQLHKENELLRKKLGK